MMTFGEAFTEIILPAVFETIIMVVAATLISIVLGFLAAVIFYVTQDQGLRPNPVINRILGTSINIVRSFPFIILIVAIIPLTRLITGTSVGIQAAIVPLTVAAAPFMTMLFTNSFNNINHSLIEAAKSFGLTDFQIMRRIVIKESVPSLIQDLTLSIISIINTSAMAGAVGAGGLGAVAMIYGYQNFDSQIMYGTVIVIIILVQLIQWSGNSLYRNLK